MTLNDLQRGALILFARRQAGERCSVEELKAICYCLRNRVRAGWGSWLQCIEAADDHAAHDPIPMRIDVEGDRSFQRLLHDVDEIFYPQQSYEPSDADLEKTIGQAKFWCYLNRPRREWFDSNIIRDQANHRECAQMGTMLFFE